MLEIVLSMGAEYAPKFNPRCLDPADMIAAAIKRSGHDAPNKIPARFSMPAALANLQDTAREYPYAKALGFPVVLNVESGLANDVRFADFKAVAVNRRMVTG